MEGEMRIIGMDIHRVAAEAVALLEGHLTEARPHSHDP